MEIRPILSTLLRNKTGATLIALQIALTMAVVVNAFVVIQDRRETMAQPTGIEDENLLVAFAFSLNNDEDVRAAAQEDARVLEAIDGVERVARISTMPLSNSGSASTYRNADSDDAPTTHLGYYSGDHAILETLGFTMTRGRWFNEDEIVYDPPEGTTPKVALLSDHSAEQMFGNEDPIGKYIYDSLGVGTEVIGTYEMISRPWYNWGEFYQTAIFPLVERNTPYAIRVDPQRRDALIESVSEALAGVDQDRLVGRTEAHVDVVARTYQRDVAMNRMLTVVMALVVLITALGIVGLASFSVTQRRKQIGTRRAIGAQRFHILRYFLTENWLITTFGIVLGLCLTFALNTLLISNYSLPKLDPVWLPLAVLGLWAVGLLATLGPARTAAGTDPAIATRSV